MPQGRGITLNTQNILIMATIVVYLVAMVIIGVICSKKNKSTDDFYLGGRKLGPLVTAMSAEASDMSSYLLMGLPGLALLSGLADVGWTVIGLACGYLPQLADRCKAHPPVFSAHRRRYGAGFLLPPVS